MAYHGIRVVLSFCFLRHFSRLEKGRILYGSERENRHRHWKYNCIIFANFQHSKLSSFQNLNLGFILKIFLKFRKLSVIKYILVKKSQYTEYFNQKIENWRIIMWTLKWSNLFLLTLSIDSQVRRIVRMKKIIIWRDLDVLPNSPNKF